MSRRTIATAVPVWGAAIAAFVIAFVTLPADAVFASIPLIAAAAVLLAFSVQVGTQRTDGVVRRLLITVVGIVVIAALASGLTLTLPGVH